MQINYTYTVHIKKHRNMFAFKDLQHKNLKNSYIYLLFEKCYNLIEIIRKKSQALYVLIKLKYYIFLYHKN